MSDGPRCSWPEHPLELAYHDTEWGVPVHDDRLLFELLTLEGAQAGLSWLTVLKKRERYREVLNDFDPARIARYRPRKLEALLRDPGIIRHRGKVESLVGNARAFLAVQKAWGSFAHWLWLPLEDHPIQNRWRLLSEIPARTNESDRLSKALKKSGFKFVGSTICYAFMQAAGLVNDHTVECYRFRELAGRG